MKRDESDRKLFTGNICHSRNSTADNDSELYKMSHFIVENYKVPILLVGDFSFTSIAWHEISVVNIEVSSIADKLSIELSQSIRYRRYFLDRNTCFHTRLSILCDEQGQSAKLH